MPQPTERDDVQSSMLRRLLGQFRTADNIRSLIRALATELQAIEQVFWDLYWNIGLNVAQGDTLELWGSLLNEARRGRDNDTYKAFLQTKVLRNTSQGTPERLIEILKALTNAATIQITEGSAWVSLTFRGGSVPASIRPLLALFLQAASAAGVEVVQVVEEPLNAFRFDTAGSGFDEGQFSRVI